MRQTTVLDKNWIFYKNPDSGEGENVTLPHTWNAVDGQDGGNDYYRGTCKYACTFEKPEMEQNGKAYLEFDGAAMTADVFVNGAELFHHEGRIFQIPCGCYRTFKRTESVGSTR